MKTENVLREYLFFYCQWSVITGGEESNLREWSKNSVFLWLHNFPKLQLRPLNPPAPESELQRETCTMSYQARLVSHSMEERGLQLGILQPVMTKPNHTLDSPAENSTQWNKTSIHGHSLRIHLTTGSNNGTYMYYKKEHQRTGPCNWNHYVILPHTVYSNDLAIIQLLFKFNIYCNTDEFDAQ